jgi:hypothetical protein
LSTAYQHSARFGETLSEPFCVHGVWSTCLSVHSTDPPSLNLTGHTSQPRHTHWCRHHHQACAFAENSLKSCASCNLIGPVRITAVPENCAESLQTLSSRGDMQYIQCCEFQGLASKTTHLPEARGVVSASHSMKPHLHLFS